MKGMETEGQRMEADCRPNRSRLSELPRVDRTVASEKVSRNSVREAANLWRYNEEEKREMGVGNAHGGLSER